MSYTFETTLFGLTVEVEGEFEGEVAPTWDSPGHAASFEIDTIMHKGCELGVDDLDGNSLDRLEQAAFDDAHDNYDSY
jgi:hypothetical protein